MKQGFRYINQFPDPDNCALSKTEWDAEYGQSNVLIDCKAKNIYYPLHWTLLSMKFCFNGSESYIKEKKLRYKVRDNCFLLFNNGTEYESSINSPHEVNSVTVNFSESFVSNAANAYLSDIAKLEDHGCDLPQQPFNDFFEQLYPINENVLGLLASIKKYSSAASYDESILEELYLGLFKELILFQNRSISDLNSIRKTRHSTRVEIYKRLHIAKDYIESCYGQDIKLDDLAELTFLNRYYFMRLFKSYFGITPRQFITNKRIDAAKDLLTHEISVSETCLMVGFHDLASFGKLFRKHTSLSPTEFASLHRKR